MRIGLDIDNVIADFDKTILEEFIKEDQKKRNRGIIDPGALYITEGMFDWSKEEIKTFFHTKMEDIAKRLEPVGGAKIYIDKLKEDGHEIYLISHRTNKNYQNPRKTTEEWLATNGIQYDKLILSQTTNKSRECLDNQVDIMVDDIVRNCEQIIEVGIPCLLMETIYNKRQNHNLKSVSSFQNLYNYIKKIDCN